MTKEEIAIFRSHCYGYIGSQEIASKATDKEIEYLVSLLDRQASIWNSTHVNKEFQDNARIVEALIDKIGSR